MALPKAAVIEAFGINDIAITTLSIKVYFFCQVEKTTAINLIIRPTKTKMKASSITMGVIYENKSCAPTVPKRHGYM